MFGLEDMLLDPVSSPEQKLVRGALKDYFTLQSAHDAGEGALSSIFGGNRLSDENQRLDIELKKRQLSAMGPQDSEAFNDTPARRVLQALGITWGQDLQPAKRAGIGAAKDSGFFKWAHAVEPEAKELGNVASGIGSAIGHGSPSRIARALF